MGVRKDCRPSTERHDDLKIIQLTPGAGGMYCGNCFRDNALVTEFRRSGHDALMVPLYLPLTLDEANQAEGTPIFFGGLNVYPVAEIQTVPSDTRLASQAVQCRLHHA